jgi:hypothetical protein
MADTPFMVYDCALVMRATGHSVSNLRELLAAVRYMDVSVLEHHLVRCPLADWFALEEFPNDLARWCWRDLGDHSTGERLALVDPYQHTSHESLRREIIDALEDRLWSSGQLLPSCRPGMEFHLVGSQLVAYETGVTLESVAAMAENLPQISLRSLYYHVHDAWRRTGGRTDDFSAWIEASGGPEQLVQALRGIDFYFLSLVQLRQALLRAFQEQFPAYQGPAAQAAGPA